MTTTTMMMKGPFLRQFPLLMCVLTIAYYAPVDGFMVGPTTSNPWVIQSPLVKEQSQQHQLQVQKQSRCSWDSLVLAATVPDVEAAAEGGGEESSALIFDDDDEDYPGKGKTYDDFLAKLKSLSYGKKKLGTVEHAEKVFDEMLQAYLRTDDAALRPDTEIYNMVIDMHAWAPSDDAGEKAQHYLERMEDSANDIVARPNLQTYLAVMDAWTNLGQPAKVQEVLNRLESQYETTKNEEIQPTAVVFNRLIKAWMKANLPDSAEKAEGVLHEMIERHEKGETLLLPIVKSFVQVMRCYRERQDEESVTKVRSLFEELSTLYRTLGAPILEPNTQVYNELIATLGESKSEKNGSQQAESLLYEMMEESQNAIDAIKPNAVTFRHVIYSMRRRQPQSGIAFKIENLLDLQKGLLGRHDQRNIEAALQVVAKSYDPKKVEVIGRLFQLMEDHPGMVPSLSSHNAVLNGCAHPMSENDPKGTMALAVETFNKLRDRDGANESSYAFFLKICGNLLPESSKRDKIVRNIFEKCCEDGRVGKNVLMEFLDSASEETVTELLGGNPETDGVKIPRKWSQNVQLKRQMLSP